MIDPEKWSAIEQQIAQCPAAECGDETDDEYANRVEFVLLRADESGDAKGNDAERFNPRHKFDHGGGKIADVSHGVCLWPVSGGLDAVER